MVKRTYSQRDKPRSGYEQYTLPDHDESRKRHKGDDTDELHWPPTPPSSRQGKSTSLLKKGLKKFAGPTSMPDDEMDVDVDPAPKSNRKTSVFDKALKRPFQPLKPKQHNIYGSREDFAETMKDGKKWKQNSPSPRHSQLPTPPAETHQGPGRKPMFPITNGSAVKPVKRAKHASDPPTGLSQVSEKVVEIQPSKEPYVPKAYRADETMAPRKNILGDRLPKSSHGAHMWSTNQTNSPFLRLPGEIRNLIYEYALGGNTINIGFETYRTTYKTNKPRTVTPIFKYHCTAFNRRTNPFKPTQQPYVNISTGFTPLNSICRQMYLETAALPFKLNLVSFGSHNTMFNFLFMEKRLSRQQLDAITQIVLPDALPQPNMLIYLRNLERVFLGYDLEIKSKGWYRVVRREGEDPKLVYARYS